MEQKRTKQAVHNIRLLGFSIFIPLAVGVAAGLLTRGAMEQYTVMAQPPLSPPAWLFPVVWTILYVLMGIASWLVLTSDAEEKDIERAQAIYFYQLAVNFLWPFFFFHFQWYLFSLLWLLLLWGLVFVMIWQFYKISKPAGLLCIPYLSWLTFAAYLNAGVWWLNKIFLQ